MRYIDFNMCRKNVELYALKMRHVTDFNVDFMDKQTLSDSKFMEQLISIEPNIYLTICEKYNKLITEEPVQQGNNWFHFHPIDVRNFKKERKIMYENILRDKKCAIAALQKDPCIFQYAHNEIKDTKSIARLVIKKDPRMFIFVSEKLKDDKEIALDVIPIIPQYIKHMSSNLINDKDIVKLAYDIDSSTIQFASDKMKKLFVPKKEKRQKEQKLNVLLKEGLKKIK